MLALVHVYFWLLLSSQCFLIFGHQLHFIKDPELVSSSATELSATISSIPILILKAFGLPNPDKIELSGGKTKEKIEKTHSELLTFEAPLAELGHNPLDPVSSQWLLIITGIY